MTSANSEHRVAEICERIWGQQVTHLSIDETPLVAEINAQLLNYEGLQKVVVVGSSVKCALLSLLDDEAAQPRRNPLGKYWIVGAGIRPGDFSEHGDGPARLLGQITRSMPETLIEFVSANNVSAEFVSYMRSNAMDARLVVFHP